MKNYYTKTNNKKIALYAVAIAVILGIGAIVVQDIQIPQEHVTQEVEVNVK